MRVRFRLPWRRRDPVEAVLTVLRQAKSCEASGGTLTPKMRLLVRQGDEIIEQQKRHQDELAMLEAEIAGDESGW